MCSGNTITGFIVPHTKGDEAPFNVTVLQTGREYSFAVSSINALFSSVAAGHFLITDLSLIKENKYFAADITTPEMYIKNKMLKIFISVKFVINGKKHKGLEILNSPDVSVLSVSVIRENIPVDRAGKISPKNRIPHTEKCQRGGNLS